MKRFFRTLLACACLWLPAAAPAQTAALAAPSTRPAPKPGDLAPDFTAIDPEGSPVKLSDFRGKLVLVDLWATWCGPCVAAMPHNSTLAEKFAADGLVILAVNADDTRENYEGWLRRNRDRYKFLTAHDPAGKAGWADSVFNTHYGVKAFPTLFLIDRDGRLVGSASGGGSGENPQVTRLLAKGGLPIDTSHLPPEEPAAPPQTLPLIGMGAPAAGTPPASPVLRFGQVEAGKPAPDFTVTGPDGQPVKLSDFKGRTVFVSFWTGARLPSADTIKIAADYRDQGLVVLAVNIATDKADFDQWYAAHKDDLGYRVAWDPAGKAAMESVAYMNYGIGMFPAYFLVKPDGTLAGGIIGMGERVSAHLRDILARGGLGLTAADRELLAKTAAAIPAATVKAAPQPAAPAGAGQTSRPSLLGPGDTAPDFAMHDVEGRTVKLSDFKGKVVVLDFWATWCGPCLASFPHTQELAANYKDQNVVVLASGTSDTVEKFKEWIPRNQPKYPDMVFVFDPHERGSATFEERASAKLYGVTAIPTQFVIGPDGRIAATIIGNGGKDDARTAAALASLGVKVDEGTVTKGKAQLEKAAEDAARRAAAAAEAERNPPPPFRENFGRLTAGEAVPDFEVQNAAGEPVKFLSSYAQGKTVVLGLWSAGMGPPAPMLELWETWGKRYRDQGVVFAGLGAFDSRDAFDQWRADNRDKVGFPLVFDPSGRPPRPEKPFDEMTDDEKRTFSTAQREHSSRVIPMQLGGIITPLPSAWVIDAQGRLVGWFAGYGQQTANAVGNLLHRAGVRLAAADTPARLYTAAETAPAPVEERVRTIEIGATAPDFTTLDLDGKPVKLSDYKGKVVVLDFWATWCGPCMVAMPHTQEVAAKYKEQGVVVLGSCTSDTRAKFEEWVRANRQKYPDIVWSHDAAERTPERASRKLYGVSGIPTQFVIGRDGRIVDIVIGYRPGEAILDGALAKAGVEVAPSLVEKAKADLATRAALAGEPPVPAQSLVRPATGKE